MKRFVALILFMLVCSPVIAHDYHVVGMINDESTNQISVVFHIAVPIENNGVGHSYREAVSESVGGAAFVSGYFGTSSAELTQLQNGELIEHLETLQLEDSLTLVQKRSIIDARFTLLSTTAGLNKLYKKRLNFYGLDRDVP